MERNFTNENFEGFLKQNADRYRMRPSDKVWNNISKSLNKRRRYTIGLSALFLVTGLLGYLVINEANRDLRTTSFTQATPGKTNRSQQNPPSVTGTSIPTHTAKFIGQRNIKPVSAKTSFSLISEINGDNIIAPSFFFESTIIDSDPEAPQPTKDVARKETVWENDQPLSIESVINSYKAAKKKKLGFQFYFTPTVSYRRLSENKSYLRSAGNNLPSNYPALHNNVNNLVTHKPDMGFELGFTSKYAISKNLKLRAGLQFNVNRYDIKAFRSTTEVATITLNNTPRNRPDSVRALSNYSNFNGYKTNWLQNYYFQVSSPVGVEYTVKGNKNIQFGVASTIQPTYLLGDRAYMISSDYKNYVEVPWLVRRWNVNTNLETFVAYSTGKMNWQVGPQVRYQLLSSFISKYPVKENLFDFGLKVGISLNK